MCEREEHLVADHMPVAVVDLLEIVDGEQHKADNALRLCGEHLLCVLRDRVLIEQIGRGVAGCLNEEASLLAFIFCMQKSDCTEYNALPGRKCPCHAAEGAVFHMLPH